MSANGRVVVLGGTGFLGRHVCAALDERGVEVVSVARGAPADLPPWRFLALDLVTRPARELARELGETGAGVVVNAVGSIWGRRDDQMWEAAAVPTLRLLDALETLPVRPRLVHLGSVLEYGRMREGSSTTAVAETRPTSAYGRAKLAATRAVLDRFHTGELTGMVLRISNIAGPGSPDVSLLGQVAGQLLQARGGPAVIRLDPLLAHRDYVDVRDVAEAVVAAAMSPCSGELIDIGSGESTSVRSLVDLLIQRSGLPAVVEEHSGTGRQHSTETWSRVDTGPAWRSLGWRPRRPLTDAVEAYWREFTERQDVATRKGEPSA
ncbi:dTDP-6-deoxy-L-talose 4-dehydrogenase [NAD(P)+] [Streptomyces sp. Ag82_O1-12]|uniref:NAD-dependent epimerase/dehydratase family protein n=1 Tax=unclassified Streptomyces TaxID=2593676 RepID=UPI000BD7AFA6|nr:MULTISPECIES: NAD(P)-dependent oxidoreductase [unclassified Streptomyces]SMQ14613.1 dTDP-6-deoxy-L-talose 4-dehydrogenase [NAD(P)+] [Streptomyces sp. Ag82_O1-12]SOD43640.1 dTDP-6-deoxy-L-talose 4-dehydrogenase [NAD(P)+] [Streptomyces sp. Ag82_G6-1]